MANTIQLRRSAVASAVPTIAQLALGELAINTNDGRLYLKKNVSGTESIVEVGSAASGDMVAGGALVSNSAAGDEGGEIRLNKPVTNSTISTSVTIDVYQNRLRIFETGGSNRGAYIDLTAATNGVGSNLLAGGGGGSSNSFATITAQTGTTTANSATDTLTITGGTDISTSISGDTLTISYTGTGGGSSGPSLGLTIAAQAGLIFF